MQTQPQRHQHAPRPPRVPRCTRCPTGRVSEDLGQQTDRRGAPRTQDWAGADRTPCRQGLSQRCSTRFAHTSPISWPTGRPAATHRALVGLLARVSAHVHHQHVLRLEGLLLPCAGLPATHELLLLPVDVLVVDMLPGRSPRGRVSPSTHPSRPHLVYADQPPRGPASRCRPRLLLSYLGCIFQLVIKVTLHDGQSHPAHSSLGSRLWSMEN